MKKKSSDIFWHEILLVFCIILISLVIFYWIDFEKIKGSNLDVDINTSFVGDSEDEDSCSNLPEDDRDKCIVDNSECLDDECLYSKAMIYGDESSCDNIEDENKVAACTSSLKRSEILERSIMEGNILVCEEFEEENNKAFCRDNYYIAKRFNEEDKSYCSNIIDVVIKEDCER